MALPFAARLAAFIARPDRLGRNVAMKREQLIPLANYLKDLTPGTRVSATALGKTFGTKRDRIPELAKALDLDIKFGEGKLLKGTKNPYMKEYFENYRKKCSANSILSTEELITQICNDFQIWHLNKTYFFSPLKHISLLTLLSADTETLLGQVTDAKLSKAIIEKCNPKLLDLIDPLKNQNDPVWFP